MLSYAQLAVPVKQQTWGTSVGNGESDRTRSGLPNGVWTLPQPSDRDPRQEGSCKPIVQTSTLPVVATRKPLKDREGQGPVQGNASSP